MPVMSKREIILARARQCSKKTSFPACYRQQSTSFEKEDRSLADIKMNKVFRLKASIRSKLAGNETMPTGLILLVRLSLDVRSNILNRHPQQTSRNGRQNRIRSQTNDCGTACDNAGVDCTTACNTSDGDCDADSERGKFECHHSNFIIMTHLQTLVTPIAA